MRCRRVQGGRTTLPGLRQGALERLDGLRTGDGEALVEDEERHTGDADLTRRRFVGAHVLSELVAGQAGHGIAGGNSGPDALGDVLRPLGLLVGFGAVALDKAAKVCGVQKRDLGCRPRCLRRRLRWRRLTENSSVPVAMVSGMAPVRASAAAAAAASDAAGETATVTPGVRGAGRGVGSAVVVSQAASARNGRISARRAVFMVGPSV